MGNVCALDVVWIWVYKLRRVFLNVKYYLETDSRIFHQIFKERRLRRLVCIFTYFHICFFLG